MNDGKIGFDHFSCVVAAAANTMSMLYGQSLPSTQLLDFLLAVMRNKPAQEWDVYRAGLKGSSCPVLHEGSPAVLHERSAYRQEWGYAEQKWKG